MTTTAPLDVETAIFICAARAAKENRAPWDIAMEAAWTARLLGDADTADAYRAAGRYYTESSTATTGSASGNPLQSAGSGWTAGTGDTHPGAGTSTTQGDPS